MGLSVVDDAWDIMLSSPASSTPGISVVVVVVVVLIVVVFVLLRELGRVLDSVVLSISGM